MTDKPYDPLEDPEQQRKWIRVAVWWLDLTPLEKLVFLEVIDDCVWSNVATTITDLDTIAQETGASILDTSKALSSLKTLGVLKIDESRLLAKYGIQPKMFISPDFQGVRDLFWAQRERKIGGGE